MFFLFGDFVSLCVFFRVNGRLGFVLFDVFFICTLVNHHLGA